MSLTVTADGARRRMSVLRLPASPMASPLVAGITVLVVALAVLVAPSPQLVSPWLLPLVLGPACVFLAAVAVATVPVTPRPADRAERGLRGAVAVAVPVVASALLARETMVSALAVAVVPVLVVAVGVVAARRSGDHQAAPPDTSGGPVVRASASGPGLPAEPLPVLCGLLKRSVDVVFASAILVLSVPVLALAAVAIVAESRGGVLFRQTRVGSGGRRFQMYKLRTMRPANDEAEHQAYVAELIRGQGRPQGGMYKLVADDRRTGVGRVLRSFSIDELPQLWNVVRGDMSIVGPRPPLPAEVALYDEATWARMAATPGLTGLWQVSGRSRLSFQEMVELDVRYWQEWTPLLDLRILLRTPKAVLWGRETA